MAGGSPGDGRATMLILTALVHLLLLTTAHAQPPKAVGKAKAAPKTPAKPKSLTGKPLNNTLLKHAVGNPLSTPAAAPTGTVACTLALSNDALVLHCDGDHAVVANVDPALAKMGIKLKLTGDNLNSNATAGCPTPDIHPVPLVTLCAASAMLSLENSTISGFTTPLSRPQRPVLGVVGAGEVLVSNLLAEEVQGGTAVRLHALETVVVRDSKFIRNSARESLGGALLITTAAPSKATVHLTGNTFTHNSAATAGAAAIMLQTQDAISVLIDGMNSFANNTASYGAGALLINATASTHSNIAVAQENEFISNLCFAGGGAVSILLEGSQYTNVTVAGGTFESNTARNDDTVPASGGGLYIAAAGATGTQVTLKGRGEFHRNTASRSGGGLYVNMTDTTSATVFLGGSYEFIRNTAAYEGGGAKIDFSGAASPRAVVRRQATFVGNAAKTGGGMYVDFTLSTGAAAMEVDGEVTFNRNTAETAAGGLMVDVGSVPAGALLHLLGNITFTNNEAKGTGGGLVFSAPGAAKPQVRVRGNVLFEANTANMSAGLAVLLAGSQSATVDLGPRGIYGRNVVLRSGGAVGVDITNASSATVALRGSYQANKAEHRGGGCAVWADESTKCKVELVGSSSWEANQAQLGGGVWVSALGTDQVKVLVMDQVRIWGNNAFFGGGVWASAERSELPAFLVSGSASFRNNTSNGGEGGGMYVRMSHCDKPTLRVLQNVEFVNNHIASNSPGGGLFVNASYSSNPGVLVLDDILFADNQAHWGGGIDIRMKHSNTGKIKLGGNVLLRNNNATYGGGLHMDISVAMDVQFEVTERVRVSNNTGGQGAGLLLAGTAVENPKLMIAGDVIIDGNQATNEGGGIAMLMDDSNDVELSLSDTVMFTRNTGSSGGGLYWDGEHSNMATLFATGTVRFLDNNATTGPGGGAMLFWEDTSTASVHLNGSVAFQGNWAGTSGGGLAVATRTVVHLDLDITQRVAFDANTAAAGDGGGLYFDGTSAAAVNVSIAGRSQYIGNEAANGGGFYLDVRNSERATVALVGNGTVSKGNRARLGGGGGLIHTGGSTEGSSVNVEGGIWQFNLADRGGALALYANASNTSMALSNAEFLNNEAVSGAGGGVYLQLGVVSAGIQGISQVKVSRTRFLDNIVRKGGGGGAYVEGSSAVLDGCWRGLDVSIYGLQAGAPCPPSFTFEDCYFEGNNATLGGALYAINTQAEVTGATFVKNTASKLGGGLYVKKMQSMTVGPAVTIQGNSAGKQGGGVYSTVSDDLLPNRVYYSQVIVAGNSAGTQGGGLTIYGGPTEINDTNIMNNTAKAQGGGIAYFNICDEQDCALRLQQGTKILGNKARLAPVVYLGSDDKKGVDWNQLTAAASEDGTMTAQSAGVASAPTQLKAQQEEFMSASSTGDTGKIDLVVEMGQLDNIRVQVEMCDYSDENDEAVLMGTQAKTIAGVARFTHLRLLKAQPGKRYCLRVSAPNYEDVAPIMVYATIRDCIAGEVINELGCSICPANTYSFAFGPKATCRPCARNAVCAGGVTLVPKCGFWHANTTSTTLLSCPNREACCGSRAHLQSCQRTHTCPAGEAYMAKQCSPGYRGRLCGACDRSRGYGASGFLRCTKCVSAFGTAVLIFFAMTVVAALIMYMANTAVHEAQRTVRPDHLQSFRKHVDRSLDGADGALLDGGISGGIPPLPRTLTQRMNDTLAGREIMEATGVFKILVTHLQYLVLLGSLLVDWPDVVTGFISALKLFVLYSVDNTRVLSLECLGVGGNGGRMLLALLFPLLAVALAASLGALWRARAAARKSQARRLADDRITIPDMVVACAVVGGALIYANLLTTSLSAFSCVRVGSTLHWARDVDVKCWSHAHLSSSLLWGLLGLLLLCLLAPVAVILAITRHQAAVEANTSLKPAPAEKQFARRFGFLYRLYRPEYCFWEGAVCLQTVVLVFISLYGRRAGVYYQVLLDLLVLAAGTTLVRVLRPFRTRAFQRLYLSSSSVLLLTCVGALSLLWEQRIEDNIDGTSLRGFIAFLVLSLNLGYVLWCAYEIWRAVRDATMKKVQVAKQWWGWMKGGRVGSFRPATSIMPLAAGGGEVGAAGAAEGLWVDNLQRIRMLQLQASDIESTRLRSADLGSSATLPMSSVASISFQYED